MEAAEKDSSFAVAPLAETFRSRATLIEFLNAFFRHVWPAGSSFEYSEDHTLTAAPDPKRHAWQGPAGELLLATQDEAVKAEQQRWQQARAIAARIRCLVTHGNQSALVQPQVWDKKEGQLREPRYGDIAILARSVKNIRVPLQLALSHMGIPFRMLGGMSFFTRPEVLDAGNLLACALQPCEDLALAGLLRSPFVGLSDGGLWRLQALQAAPGKLESLPHKLAAAAAEPAKAGFDGEDAAALRQAAGLLAELRAGCGRRTAAELIDVACRMTGFLGVLALKPQGDVAVAAVRRVIELARAFEAKGARHLSDFVRWLRERADAEWDDPGTEKDAREGFGPLEGENAVEIGTIHSAKGLEFPIVIVADVGAKPPPVSDAAMYLPKRGLGLKLGIEQEGLEPAADEVHEDAQDAEKNADGEERRRLLYVALTRARDYLVLVGENVAGTKNDAGNWRNIVREFMKSNPGLLNEVAYDHDDLRNATPEQPQSLVVFHDTGATLRAGIVPAAEEHGPAALLQGLAAPGAERLARRDIRLSVSELTRCLACPRRVALSLWVGDEAGGRGPLTLPSPHGGEGNEEVEPPEPEDTEDGSSQARALGIAAHAVLEAVFSDAKGSLQEQWAVAASAAGISGDGDGATIVRNIQGLVASDWGRAVLEVPVDGRFVEKPFRVRAVVDPQSGSAVTLTGKMDLLVSPAPGRWQVFDYKVAARPATGAADDTAMRYGWQALLYGIAAGRVLSAAEPVEPALIFLRDDPPHPVTLRELGFSAKAPAGVLESVLRSAWENAQQLDPMKQPAQVWLPGQPAPLARSRARCRQDRCPFVERCFGIT
ncbi:MAG: PD-(D/E)XK nuclease family protein [Planctomycetota bacterium]|nr:PD-(D/E)XK nuclease family protein [Planctomycetota bacterium]